MKSTPHDLTMIEPERYELFSSPAYHFKLDRREFFKIFGGGLLIICVMPRAEAGQESGRRGFGRGEQAPTEISAWLHIGENGQVTVYTGKVEVGQNSRTALTQAVAEELRVAPASIQMVMGDTDLTPFDMGTFGSRTTPTMNPQLRKAANAALEVLLDMAAKTWGVDKAKLAAANGKITDPASGRSTEYAQLLKGKELAQTMPAVDPLTPADQWTVMGKPLPKVNGRDFVTGKHRYPSDIKLPGMWYGKVLRPSAFNATVVSVNTEQAEGAKDVTVVHDGDFIGVAAATPELASRAIAAIHVEWKSPEQPSRKDLFDYLKQNTEKENGGGRRESPRNMGSLDAGWKKAEQKSAQTYTVAYIAHTPLEPRAAVAEWKDGKLNVWTGTQRPFGVKGELAQVFHLPEDHVRVRMPDTGAGYGGKHTGECAVEAARLARAAGHPVKLVWTREEEFTWAYFRPAGVIEVSGGVTKDGLITAWEFHNYNSGGSGIDTPYEIANQHIEFHPTKYPLRQGSYRGLAATANHFARESHMDDLAHLAKMDPLEFRLKNLKNDRLIAVFQVAADKFGWGKTASTPERGLGIAGGVEKGGYVATCAEVKINRASGEVKIVRVVTAFECGAVVNPDGLQNQVEGANIMGIGGAMFEAIDFSNGRILNPKLSKYRVPRFSDVPAIEVVLVDRKDLTSAGAGETPLIGLAPAVGNAIFSATGTRLRALPMVPDGIKL
jgi:CO/xanthine dehydrogenase Mo-binding subunit